MTYVMQNDVTGGHVATLTMSDKRKKYRQALRDLTKSATSIDYVTWPTIA